MRKLVLAVAVLYSFMGSSVSATSRELRCEDRHNISKMVATQRSAGRYQVDYVMWRESRCRQVAFNPNDPNGGSYGLFQINAYWCKPSRYYRRGWLQAQGILDNCEDLFNPVVNARAFIAIFDYSEKTYGNGWLPWGGTPRWN